MASLKALIWHSARLVKASISSCFPSAPRMPSDPRMMPIEVIISITDSAGMVDLEADSQGRYPMSATIGGADGVVSADGTASMLKITAKEASGFRDEHDFTDAHGWENRGDPMAGEGGGIDDADPATVTVLSGEETPTVDVLDR